MATAVATIALRETVLAHRVRAPVRFRFDRGRHHRPSGGCDGTLGAVGVGSASGPIPVRRPASDGRHVGAGAPSTYDDEPDQRNQAKNHFHGSRFLSYILYHIKVYCQAHNKRESLVDISIDIRFDTCQLGHYLHIRIYLKLDYFCNKKCGISRTLRVSLMRAASSYI